MNSKITIFLSILFLLTLGATAQKKGYKKGYIILQGKTVQQGYVKYTTGSWSVWKSKPGSLRFKFSPDAAPIKAKDDVTGFVIESDSFTIEKNIYVNDMAPVFKKDFVKVVDVGRIDLFLHQCSSTTNSGGVGSVGLSTTRGYGTWILSKGSRKLTINKIKKQKESLIRLISDDEELSAKVEATKPKDIDIEEVIKAYNNARR